jgi:hypothetical protein
MTVLLPAGIKVHLAFGYTDMRKGMDGLAVLERISNGHPARELDDLLPGTGPNPRPSTDQVSEMDAYERSAR